MSLMDLIIFFICPLLLAVGAIIFVRMDSSKRKKRFIELSKNLGEFTAGQSFISPDLSSMILLNTTEDCLCIIKHNSDPFFIHYHELLECEIFENGESISKVSRTSQATGAIVGGVLLGGVGAIIGGLSGNSTTTEKVTSIILQLTINNPSKPNHTINFVDTPFNKTSILYETAIEVARHWLAIAKILIKKYELEEHEKLADKTSLKKEDNYLDDLKKLGELKASGILNEQEYSIEKSKILNRE